MKYPTLSDILREKLKDKEFAEAYQRELLINAVAELMVNLRQHKQLTQAQLAKKVGTSQSVIARLESGHDERVPSLDLLARIAHALHMRINIEFIDEK